MSHRSDPFGNYQGVHPCEPKTIDLCGRLCFFLACDDASYAADKPNASDAKKDDAKKEDWHSLFDGKALGDWKPSKFGTQGSVEVKDGQIMIGFGDGCSGITWAGEFPKTDYEIRLQAMRSRRE